MSNEDMTNSITKLRDRINEVITDAEEIEIYADADEMLQLKVELDKILRELNLDFYVTVWELENDVYPLLISHYPITGSAKENAKDAIMAFKDHKMKQRTYMYWTALETNKATWGVFTHLTDYWYYMGVPVDYEELGIARGKKKMAPILFVSACDGYCEKQDMIMKEQIENQFPSTVEFFKAKNVYLANVADKSVHRNELLTQDVEQLREREKTSDRRERYNAKKESHEYISRWKRTGEIPQEGLGSQIVYLLTKSSFRYITYIIMGILIYLGMAMVLQYTIGFHIPVPWEIGEAGGIPENTGPEPYQPP